MFPERKDGKNVSRKGEHSFKEKSYGKDHYSINFHIIGREKGSLLRSRCLVLSCNVFSLIASVSYGEYCSNALVFLTKKNNNQKEE